MKEDKGGEVDFWLEWRGGLSCFWSWGWTLETHLVGKMTVMAVFVMW